MQTSLPKILCLMGPTAAGKSQLALELAQKIPCEIISVDSAMIYRGMDIGTAKPTLDDQKLVPHHLLDICDPKESYSAGKFCEDVFNVIEKILDRNRIPLLVGGTMMYFHVLQNGMAKLPAANKDIRQKIQVQAQDKGWEYLHQQLNKIDPIAASRIHPNDPQRISRALEVCYITHAKLSDLIKIQQQTRYEFKNIILSNNNLNLLHQNIEKRFDTMLQNGFVDEVKTLFARGDLHSDLPSIRSVGYRQVWKYLSGEYSYTEMHERGIIATRQLAKRQRTWLKKFTHTHPHAYLYADNSPTSLNNLVLNVAQKAAY